MNFKPGDLVMVVKPSECCGNPRDIGLIGTIRNKSDFSGSCDFCFAIKDFSDHFELDGLGLAHKSRLIKIDPLTEQDKTETLQEITA